MVTLKDYNGPETAWCPGCGNFGILSALKNALVNLGRQPNQIVLFSGIGQAAKMPHYLKTNIFNGLHGRALPAAQAARIANHQMEIIAIGGDGDMYGEGGNHLLHAIRRNLNITLLIHDNKIYGLTKGQASPTTDEGIKTKVQPFGVINHPLNPLALAISQKCSFVARGFSGNGDHLTYLIQKGIESQGFSLIEILQPCVSFNHVNTHKWYKERIYNLNDDSNYQVNDWHAALEKSVEWGEKIPTGIFYQHIVATYEDKIAQFKGKSLVDQNEKSQNISKIIENFL